MALSFILGNYITVQWLGQDWYRVIASTFILFFAFGSIGQQTQNIPSVQKAKEAASEIFSVIDEPSALDIAKRDEKTLDTVEAGTIEFK